MKVVSFDEFGRLPEGTIYSYFEPMVCTGLHRKGETLFDEDGRPRDFFEADLIAGCWNGDPPTMDKVETQWGVFEYDQQFAIYERADIAVIFELLTS